MESIDRNIKKWDIFSDSVALDFHELMNVRHRSIHFNAETYSSVREDALFAILKIRDIIQYQFGTFNDARWFIPEPESVFEMGIPSGQIAWMPPET